MFEVISAFSKRGGKYNEDAFLCRDKYIVVLDGATGLEGIHLTDEVSDAAWLVKRLSVILEDNLSKTNLRLSSILKDAAKTIKAELDHMGYIEYTNAYPSASIAIVRKNGLFIECLALGDVPIVLFTRNGIKCIYDNAVAKRDQKVIDKMISIHEQTGCSISEARREVSDLLLKNRREMNQEGAYFIFEPSGVGIDHAIAKTLLSDDINFISLMTDGFYAVKSCYNIVGSDFELMEQLICGKAKKLFLSMVKQSNRDKDFNKYPRFKPMDDATVVVAYNRSIIPVKMTGLVACARLPKQVISVRNEVLMIKGTRFDRKTGSTGDVSKGNRKKIAETE